MMTNKNNCHREFDILELGKALQQMKNDSSPGSVGLTAAWYTLCWPKIKDLVFNSILTSMETTQMSASQTRGIIRLIYKGKGSRNELKNWRAIALTNVDYNILAKCLANRLKEVVNNWYMRINVGTLVAEIQP